VSAKERVAGAPVSWGVIEIPDWGYQLPVERVMREASSLGLSAMEAGPEDLLPRDPAEVSEVLASYDLSLVGGFVPAVLHEPELRERELGLVERRARFFAAAGADVLVLAAIPSVGAFEQTTELDDGEWRTFFESLKAVEEICARHDVTPALHHHFGTVVERDDQLRRFLEGCDTGLCLDTGHLVLGGSDPVEIAELAGGRVSHFHLKDVDREVARKVAARELSYKEGATQGMFRPLGDGDVDVAEVIRRVQASGYRGWYVLEQDTVVETEPGDGEGPVLNVRKSLKFLESTLEGTR
jgi:inosose dehydratase